MSRLGIIILAVGGSFQVGGRGQWPASRTNSPIQRAVYTAIASVCYPVTVVLGADFDRFKSELKSLPVTVVRNAEWAAGLGASIKCGLTAALAQETARSLKTDGTLFMLSDQPFLTSGFLDELAREFATYGGIVASAYNDRLGVPAVFGRDFYPELLSLSAAQGPKSLIERHSERVHRVDFANGVFEIDTEAGPERLLPRRLETSSGR
jgi:molybdenum cofactor cytidylyltransferase